MCDSSLSAWLSDLRQSTEAYEPATTRLSSGADLSLLVRRLDEPRMIVCDEQKTSASGPYVNLWECRTVESHQKRLRFAEERPISEVFQECAEENGEFVEAVQVENVEFYLTKDVLEWITNLWYSSEEEEEEFEEEIVHNCAQYDKKNSDGTTSSKPEGFPIDEGVQIRKKDEHIERAGKAVTLHTTNWSINKPKQNETFEFHGSYKLKVDNKTILSADTGRVELANSQIQFWKDDLLKRKETVIEVIDNSLHVDKLRSLTYRTHEGTRKIIFKQRQQFAANKNFLKKFLRRRSEKQILEKKGIIKNEDIFGNRLTALQEHFGCPVPPFVTTIMQYVEEEANIRSEHIYRIPGNMATIQRIRLQIDDKNYKILNEHCKDIEVLTGTLKLFYRELVDPVITYRDFDKICKLVDKPDGDDKYKLVRNIVEDIVTPNKENLKELIRHLLKVDASSTFNKMSLKSLAIVWGPSLIWHQPDKCPNYNAIEFSMLANKVIELILTTYHAVSPAEMPKNAETSEDDVVSASKELSVVHEDQISRSISDDGSPKIGVGAKFFSGSFFGLKKSESKEKLSASSWSLSSFGSESKKGKESGKDNYNPYCGRSWESLQKRSNTSVPWIISELVTQINRKLDTCGLYIQSANKDYMAKFNRKAAKTKPDLSQIEALDLAIILVKILRELSDPLIPEDIFQGFCEMYAQTTSKQRDMYVEERIQNLTPERQETLTLLMDHLYSVFRQQPNKDDILNVWLPVICNTTSINFLTTSFNSTVFGVYERKILETLKVKESARASLLGRPERTDFGYKVSIQNEKGSLKTTVINAGASSSLSEQKFNLSNTQLNNISSSVQRNASKYSKS